MSSNGYRVARSLCIALGNSVHFEHIPWGSAHWNREHAAGMWHVPGWRSRDLFLRNDFRGGVFWALLVRFLRETEGVVTESLLLGCRYSHRHLKNFRPALDVPQHPSPLGCWWEHAVPCCWAGSAHICPAVCSRLFYLLNSCFVLFLFYFNRLQQQWLKNSVQEAWTLRELPRLGMAGVWCFSLGKPDILLWNVI